MRERIAIAGSGGQGTILLGKLLASAALETVPHVTFFPSYGAEVRGGTVSCRVILASSAIASPVCEQFDSLILMHQASADTFLPLMAPEGTAIVNSSLCSVPVDTESIQLPASEKANAIGAARAANLILLGAYIASKPLIPVRQVERCIEKWMMGKDPALLDLNIQAFHLGLSYLT